MTKHILQVKKRTTKEKNKKLRRTKQIPANIYGHGKPSQMIKFNESQFSTLYQKVGDTGLVYLQVEDTKKDLPTMIGEIQEDPITDKVLHVTFQEVSLAEKVQAEVVLEIVGETDVPDTVLVTVRDSVLVEALPTDLPEKIEVDITGLVEIGQSITLADLKFNKEKVSLVIGEEGEDAPVVILQAVKEEVVVEEPVEDEVAGEDEDAAGGEEKEAPTDGEDKSEKKEKQAGGETKTKAGGKKEN